MLTLKKYGMLYIGLNVGTHFTLKLVIPSPKQMLNTLQDLELENLLDIPKDTDTIVKDDNGEENENVPTNLPPVALLTQKDQLDQFYEQYSIIPLHDKKMNSTDTELYQMLKIIAAALDVRGKDLDFKCFPIYILLVCMGNMNKDF